MYSDQNQNGGLIQTDQQDHGFPQSHNIPNSNNPNPNPNFAMDDDPSSNCNNTNNNPLEMELHHQFNLEIDHCNTYAAPNGGAAAAGGTNNDIQELIVNDANTWQEMANNFQPLDYPQNNPHFLPNSAAAAPPYPPTTPDLLTMFPFPRCSSMTLPINVNPGPHRPPSFLASLGLLGELNDGSSTVVYDPLLPLNLPPQPPLLRELFHSLPHGAGGYNLGGPRNGGNNNGPNCLFGGVDEIRDNGVYSNGDGRAFDNGGGSVAVGGVFEFTAGEMDSLGKNRDIGKDTKHFATERHRRVLLNDKYKALRNLVPNPTKNDRASIVGDAIDYINELKRTVTELKVLVEKKRCARERLKRPKTEDESIEGGNNNDSKCLAHDVDNSYNNSPLRSSWLHRKSKNTEVDVRIIDDEVTVKLVQQKRINCLLFVSKVLDDFHLDLHHVAGGLIGDYYSFLLNSKICEGSIVYASAVANNLIEVVDKQYAAILPTNSY
ncbi:transcription factor bHLH91-like [Andrographis paniculata]|uniref:transcription factor bHLH91-like n=1 Tax=Andrographis paniculata TaxID=175694 RepID=UPI0021E74593|nr:transcription factor bHLH91-like [Andrographis paniculata]